MNSILQFKKNRLAEWIRKQNLTIFCIQETHLTHKETHRLKVKEWKAMLHALAPQKKSRGSNPVCRQSKLQTKTDQTK